MVRLQYGVVSRSVTSLTQKVVVELYSLKNQLGRKSPKFEDCMWMPRYDIATDPDLVGPYCKPIYPQVGDKCLVAFDNLRQPWVIVWWPNG